jgi:hypothetical protein
MKPIDRIQKVLDYYYKRGHNSERINKLYRKIIKQINYEVHD